MAGMTWPRRLAAPLLIAVVVLPIACHQAPGRDGDAMPDGISMPRDAGDETVPLQQALDAMAPGETLRIPPGIHRHSKVLTVRVADVRIIGDGATLIADDEERSALHIAADRVVVSGLALGVGSISHRWEGPDQHKVRISAKDGVELHKVRVLNSAASGVFIGSGAGRFLLDSVRVNDTMADGIHMTDGAHDGRVVNPTVTGTGDDGVAVVSYGGDAATCHDIAIEAPWVESNKGGRGISVVGGESISYTDVRVSASNAAAVYVAVEAGPYNTRATRDITVTGGQLIDSNRNTGLDHGAVLVYSARRDERVEGVHIQNLKIRNTRPEASRQVGLLSDGGGAASDITFEQVEIHGGPRVAFSSNLSPSTYSLIDWQVDGSPYPWR